MDTILRPIMWVVSYIMYAAHWVFDAIGVGTGPVGAWVLAIVVLTIVMRVLLIPLFVKQIKATRGMQLLQPEMQAIQKKYKDRKDAASREAMSRETMDLYKKHGTNPFASCLPMLLQSPIFFALFRLLNNMPSIAAGPGGPVLDQSGVPIPGRYGIGSIGAITQDVAQSIMDSDLFGARLSQVFMHDGTPWWTARTVILILILAMSVTTFTTQRQLTRKNMPASAMQGPGASMQKIMLYVLPLIFLVSGMNFPVGVLIYWTVTNLWSMGQQYYTIRRNPTPGSEAEKLYKERQAKKLAAKGIVLDDPAELAAEDAKPVGQRVQPQRKNRKKKG